jgi:2-methylisocitrate lyase-like PEP mutase family enzyme
MSKAREFRRAWTSGRLQIAPGAYDCITARAVERAGYPAVYMSGAGTAAAAGFPDYGLLTMTEMVSNASRMAASIQVPLIADADTGFGNELNAVRAIRAYEANGVAAIHVEDQVFPKKCGHLSDKAVVPIEDYVAKIRAMVAARTDPDFTIIARSDARGPHGLDEAIRRVNAALDAGADIAFVEAPQTIDEVLQVPRRVHGPCLLNVVWNGKTPDLSFQEIESAGYRVAILPGVLLGAILELCDEQMRVTTNSGRHAPAGSASPQQFFSKLGADEWDRVARSAR